MPKIFSDPLKSALFATIITVSFFKLWALNLFPITCDESYYWLWHKHLTLSFVDHPPLIAYFNKFISLFGEYNLFHFRLAGLVLALLATYFIWKTGKTLVNDKVGLIAATLFQLVPHYIIVWLTLTVDNLLAFFWVLSLYFVAKISKEKKPHYWFLLGISLGLGFLSKYTMFFFIPLLIVYFAIEPDQRFWFKKIEPYLGVLASILVFSPVLIWNLQNKFISLGFHSGRLGHSDLLQNFLSLTVDQLVHFSPFLFLGLLIYNWQLWKKSRFLSIFSFTLMLVFFGFTPYIRVWAHWVITYQFAAIIGIAWMISENAMATRRLLISLWVFDALLVVLLLFSSSMLLPRQEAYEHNRLLVKQYAAIPLKDVIITPYIGSSSQLAFYTHRQTYMAQGDLKIEDNGFGRRQYELWGSPKLSKGSNIIFYGPADAVTREKLKKLFQRIEVRTDLKLSVIESYLDELVPYYCYGLLNADRVL